MSVCLAGCTDRKLNRGGSDASLGSDSNCHCCGENTSEDLSITSEPTPAPNCKLSKSNILDKLHLKLNQLNKLNAHVQKCNDELENVKKHNFNSFQSKIDYENFLRETYNDKLYSYCVLKCKPSVPHRQLRALQVKNNRIPGNMGWNWKLTHSENWQPGSLPKIIKKRMSHFLNYYPCDTLPITRLSIKLSKSSFNNCDNRESKIKRMIQSMGFSSCSCNKTVAWCMCRDKNEMTKLKNVLEQIEKQIGESGLEYKLYLNEIFNQNGKKMASFDERTKAIPDLINQETQYEPMDYKILRGVALKACTDRLSKPKSISTTTAKPNNSTVTIPDAANSKDLKKSKAKIN